MKKLFAALLGIAVTAAPALAIDLNPGLYRVTVKMEMQGMPNMMPATTMNQCLTEEDPVPKSGAGAQGCEVKDLAVNGNTVSYAMVCNQEGVTSETRGETTYSGDSFAGNTTMEMNQGGNVMVMSSKITGVRVGPCQ